MINWQNGTTPINETNMNKLVQEDMITDAYSSSSTYAVGDYCIYENTLYKCTTAIATAEAWNSAHWTAVTVTDEIKENMEYSTEERRIGTWIDGKSLYRRIYQFDLPQCVTSGTPVAENHIINNAGFSFIEFGYIYADFINAPIPYVTRQNPSQNIGCDLTTPNTLRIWNSFKDWNSAKAFVSVLYTKTTD